MDVSGILTQAFNAMLLVSLMALIVASILPKQWGRFVAAAGWVVFGVYWGLSTPNFYLHEHNIMYTVACIIAIPATFYAAFILVRYGRESLMVLTRAAAIASVFYFPFDYIAPLNQWLIEATTAISFAIVTGLGEPGIPHVFA